MRSVRLFLGVGDLEVVDFETTDLEVGEEELAEFGDDGARYHSSEWVLEDNKDESASKCSALCKVCM